MPYTQAITRDLRKISTVCYCCPTLFKEGEYKAIHSATGLHLVLEEADKPPRYVYRVTDPPEAYAFMMNSRLEVNEFAFGFRYFADAVCVCNSCHIAIHALALDLCRDSIPDFAGNTPTPRLLVEATFNLKMYAKIPA